MFNPTNRPNAFKASIAGFDFALYRYNTPSNPETHGRWFLMGDSIPELIIVAGPDATADDAQRDALVTIRGRFVAALQALDSK